MGSIAALTYGLDATSLSADPALHTGWKAKHRSYNMNKKTAAILMATCLIAVAGCAKKDKPQDLPPPPVGAEGNTGATETTGPAPGSQADFVASIANDRIYFDTDKSDIDAEDQSVLASQAVWLKKYPHVRVTIEGHCDERGTREYNMALGERRANSARDFLLSQGVPANRLLVTSWGKERPVAPGSDESAWAQNRRVVTVVVR